MGQKLASSKARTMAVRSWSHGCERAWVQVGGGEFSEGPTHWRPSESVSVKLLTRDEPSDL